VQNLQTINEVLVEKVCFSKAAKLYTATKSEAKVCKELGWLFPL